MIVCFLCLSRLAINICANLCALCFVWVHCESLLVGSRRHTIVTFTVALTQTLISYLMISYSKPLACTVIYLARIESALVGCSIAIGRM